MKYPEDYINKVIQGDCLEVMKQMPDKCVDLVLTSPPYDGLRDYDGYSFDFEGTAKEVFRVTKDGSVVVWVVGDSTIDGSESGTSLKQALFFKEIGFRLHDTMIYHKTGKPLTHNRYEQHFEYMFVFSKGKPNTFNGIMNEYKNKGAGRTFSSTVREKDGKTYQASGNKLGKVIGEYGLKGNIWFYETGMGHTTHDKGAYEHPAMFPEKLAQDHIYSWCNEGDVVLDPFNGSGTTTKMSKILKRKYIGIELSEKYCEIANERLKQEQLF